MNVFKSLFFLIIVTYGQAQTFEVSRIPVELMANADVVVRQHSQTFTIVTKNKASLHIHEVYTILNPKGKSFAEEVVDYDKLRKVISFSGTAYDADGKTIKKLKSGDIADHSMYDGSLYSDNRLKIADLSQAAYPYTVEFDYEIDYKYLFDIPGMRVIPKDKIAVENTVYTLIYPKELMPRYNLLNTDVKAVLEPATQGKESMSWTFKNLKAINLESSGPSAEEIFPSIMAAPVQFEFEGYEGRMDSWQDFGQWINTLNKGRSELSEATKQQVKALTANAKTNEEKTRILYEYLQSKTRYVSIQLGIGGFQPFPASVVDQVGYGDCKALSNYMVALLNAADIKGYYTLIYGGESNRPLKTRFPSSQFNHAVVAVPDQMDTIWLECTSQTNPFGYQGTFTGNRKALMITNEGGKVVNTTRYKGEKNIQIRKADVIVELTGDAKANVITTYSGLQYENEGLSDIVNQAHDRQRKWLQETVDIPSFDVKSFTILSKKEKQPVASVAVDLTLKRFGSVSGKRIFFTPNLMNRSMYIPEKLEQRKSNVVRRMAYEDIDTVQYHFAGEFYPEFNPEPIVLKSRFGEYRSSHQFSEGKLLYIRHIKMNEGVFPSEAYTEFVDFYKSINKADNLKIALVNKT